MAETSVFSKHTVRLTETAYVIVSYLMLRKSSRTNRYLPREAQ